MLTLSKGANLPQMGEDRRVAAIIKVIQLPRQVNLLPGIQLHSFNTHNFIKILFIIQIMRRILSFYLSCFRSTELLWLWETINDKRHQITRRVLRLFSLFFLWLQHTVYSVMFESPSADWSVPNSFTAVQQGFHLVPDRKLSASLTVIVYLCLRLHSSFRDVQGFVDSSCVWVSGRAFGCLGSSTDIWVSADQSHIVTISCKDHDKICIVFLLWILSSPVIWHNTVDLKIRDGCKAMWA